MNVRDELFYAKCKKIAVIFHFRRRIEVASPRQVCHNKTIVNGRKQGIYDREMRFPVRQWPFSCMLRRSVFLRTIPSIADVARHCWMI